MIIIVWFCIAASEMLLAAFLYGRCGEEWFDIIRILVLNGWLFFTAYMDLKNYRITNRWILCGLCAGGVFWIAELIAQKNGGPKMLDCILGACLGSGILLGGSMIRKGGIGMGDVKLFFILGLFCGTERVFFLLLLTLVFALLVGAVRMMLGKMGRKDRLPLGPFAYAAWILTILSENPG